jgi:phage-related protein
LLDGIEQHGLNAPRIIFRPIEGKLWEIKIKLPKVGGYRIFYCLMEKEIMLLLHAYQKKSQKAPKRAIETARKRMADALNRGI